MACLVQEDGKVSRTIYILDIHFLYTELIEVVVWVEGHTF